MLRPFAGCLLIAVTGVCTLQAAPASAAPTIAYAGQFSFPREEEGTGEVPPTGMVATRTGGGVWMAAETVTTDDEGKFISSWPIRRFSASGGVAQTIEDPEAPTGERQVSDLDLSLDGQVLYVPAFKAAGPTRTSLGVLRLDAATGQVLGSFATPGNGPGNASAVGRVSVAPDGDVYASAFDANDTRRLKRYSATGAYEADVTLSDTTLQGAEPAFDPRNGDLLVADESDGSVHVDRYSPDGTHLGQFGTGRIDSDPSFFPGTSIAVRPQDGAVYVTMQRGVAVFTARGAFVRTAEGPPAGNSCCLTKSFSRLSVRPDGTRLWALSDSSKAVVQHFAIGQDTTPDPEPPVVPDTTITAGPAETTDDATATFEFGSDQPASTFQCRLDAAPFAACASPFTSDALADGAHTFAVRAITEAGPDPTPATRSFTVATQRPDVTPTPTPTPEPSLTPAQPVTPITVVVAPPLVDQTGPILPAKATSKSLRASKSGLITFKIARVTENTTGTVKLKTDKKVAAGKGPKRVVALGTESFTALSGQTAQVKFTLSRKSRALLKRLKTVKVQANVVIRDAKGNATIRTYRVTLKAPRR